MPSKFAPHGRGSRPLECRDCGAKRLEGATISARGLCTRCAGARNAAAQEQIQAREGPHYEEYRRGVVKYAQRLISG